MRTASLSPLPATHCFEMQSAGGSLDCTEVLDCDDSVSYQWDVPDPETYRLYSASSRCFATLPVGEVTASVRATLGDWVMEVSAALMLQRQTCQLALQLTDLYLLKTTNSLTKSSYHLLALASLLLCSKFEEVTPPKIADLRTSSGNSFSLTEIKAQERALMRTCEWRLLTPTLNQWVTWVTYQWDSFASNFIARPETCFWDHCDTALRLQAQASTLMDGVILDECRTDLKELSASILFVSIVSQCTDLPSEFLTEFEYFIRRAMEIDEIAGISMTVQYVSMFLEVGVPANLSLPCSEVKYRAMLSTQKHVPGLSAFVKKRLSTEKPLLSH